jgi:hypothetical protein
MDKKWVINYIPEDGRLTGHLEVRDDELVFTAIYDSSFKTIAKNVGLAAASLGGTGGHAMFWRENGAEAEIVMPTNSVKGATESKKGMMKRVIVELSDGTQHTFEYGLMPVKKLVNSINEVSAATT